MTVDSTASRALADLTIADFKPLVGQMFNVSHPDFSETLTLVEAKAARAKPPAGFRHGFSLLFEGASRDRWLQQAIHPLDHAALGRLELFMVPLGPKGSDGRFVYEAVFG